MHLTIETTSLLVILANFLVSLQGFKQFDFRQRYLLRVDAILYRREYHRLLTAGFLHSGWSHLIFNMLALYLFAPAMDAVGMPIWGFLTIYVGSLLGGNLLALGLHRHHDDYSALGASGAVNGVIFATIAIMPGISVWFIPGWIFGILYMLATIYGIKSQYGRISHEAHLGGALIGIIGAVIFYPQIMMTHPLVIVGLIVPASAFLILVYVRPETLLIPNSFPGEMSRVRETVGRSINSRQQSESQLTPEEEIDQLLDKGIENLTQKERKRLEELSRMLGK